MGRKSYEQLPNSCNDVMLPADICRQVFGQVKRDKPKLLRVSRAAHELGLHPFTVRQWIKQGKIQVVWVRQEIRMPRSEIERLVGKSDGRLPVLFGL
jgi:excisionase family DNA binding protein